MPNFVHGNHRKCGEERIAQRWYHSDDESLEYVPWSGAPTLLNDDRLKSLINEDISQMCQELSNKQYVLIKKIRIRTYTSLVSYERKQMDPLWIYRLW